jgi:hypothetical protein
MKEGGNGCCSEECSIKEEERLGKEGKRTEKHTCPGCKKEYDVLVYKVNWYGETFEMPFAFVTHHKSSNKCFWDAPETKQKIQEYRNKFSKWFDYKGQAGGGFAIAVNQKKLSLADLQECKKELLAIPPVDDMITLRAF